MDDDMMLSTFVAKHIRDIERFAVWWRRCGEDSGRKGFPPSLPAGEWLELDSKGEEVGR